MGSGSYLNNKFVVTVVLAFVATSVDHSILPGGYPEQSPPDNREGIALDSLPAVRCG